MSKRQVSRNAYKIIERAENRWKDAATWSEFPDTYPIRQNVEDS